MIKVALVSHTAAFAGAEKMLYSLGKLLSEDRIYYPIIFYPENKEQTALVNMCKGELETVSFSTYPWYLYVNHANKHLFADETISTMKELSRLFREHSIDLVVCNTMTSLAPMLAARDAGLPAVLWVHGILDSFYIPATYSLELRLLYDRFLMAMSRQVVCCSNWTEKYYRPMSFSNIETIVNWTEQPRKIKPYNPHGAFVCLNTFDPNKGVMTLLRAARILHEQKIEFSIKLYGSGSEEEDLKKYVARNHLEKEIAFCGRTNDVQSVYEDCCALVQPCDLESFGLTITEAMSHGRPVIAMNSGGPAEIVDDEVSGFLVEPRDVESLAEKMKYVLLHPKEAEEMGAAGRERYQLLYSPQRAKQEFVSLFEAILKEPKEPSAESRLLEDFVLESLYEEIHKSRSQHSGMTRADYSPDQLCFSGPLRNKRIYRVSCKDGPVKKIGIIFASLDVAPAIGKLKIRVTQKGRVLSEGTVSLDSIIYNVWCNIELESFLESNDSKMDIELDFQYRGNSGILGVYENRANRPFWYKVFNKLHAPLKGQDALVTQIMQ